MVDQTSNEEKSIFEDKPATPVNGGGTANNNSVDHLLQSITAEDGRQKYSSVEDAIKALAASQEHIRKIETENAEYKEKVTAASSMEEILQTLREEANTHKDEATNSPTVDANTVDKLIDQRLTQREREAISKNNINTVREMMLEKFGEDAEQKYIQAAKDAGVGLDHLNELSTISPKAVLKLVGIDGASTTPVPRSSSGSINTAALVPEVKKPSVLLKPGATTRDMVSAWRAAAPTDN